MVNVSVYVWVICVLSETAGGKCQCVCVRHMCVE